MTRPALTLIAALAAASLAAQEDVATRVLRDAVEQIRTGDLEGAIERLEALRANGPAPEPALAALGGLYAETGRAREAIGILGPLAERDDADAAVLYNAGRAAATLGERDLAARYLLRSLEQEPDSPARRELGLMLGRAGRLEQSYPYLRPWALQHPEDTEARLAAALGAVELGRVPEAEALLLDLPKDDPGVRLLRGRLLLLQGDPRGALGYLVPLVESAPPSLDLDTRRAGAKAYLAVGEAASAIELLAGRADEDPSIALQLASAYYQSGDLERALATLEPFAAPILAADQESVSRLGVEVAAEYGRLLVTDGRAAEAVPYLRLATGRAPERAQGWQALGQALAATGERDAAREALERFQQLSTEEEPESVNRAERDLADPTGAAVRRAMEHHGAGELETALGILLRESELAPEDPRPPLLASRLLLFDRQPEPALGAVRQALARAPQMADAHYQRGAVLIALGRTEEAEAGLRQALALDPDHTAAMSDLAVLLVSLERTAEARSLFERVLELQPQDVRARQNLETLEARTDP